MKRVIAVLAVALTCSAQTAAAPSPNQIYDRARAAVAARTLPRYLAYTATAAFARKGKTQVEHLRVVLRTADGRAYVTPLRDSARDRIDVTPYAAPKPPYFWPATTFGFGGPRAVEAPSIYEAPSTPDAASSAGPRVIGSVHAAAREYDVTLVDTTTLDGANMYHLHLVPRADPVHRRLREMFVDAMTFEPRRIVMQAYFARGPIATRPLVTVDYSSFEGTWLIAHARLDAVVRIAFFAYGGAGEFHLDDVSAPPTAPDWEFDPALLAQHEGATHH